MKLRGGQLNGYAGYGWKWVGPKRHRKRVPDEEERAVMKKIYEWRTAGHSYEEIARHLLLQGIRRKGGQEWSWKRVSRAYLAECYLRSRESSGPSASETVSPPGP
jgi:hypothetical protein